MVFGKDMSKNKLVGLLKNRAADNAARVPATYERRNADEDLVHQTLSAQSSVEGRTSFGQHHFGAQCCHLGKRFRKIDGAGAALQNVGMLCNPMQSRRVGIFGCHHNGALIWSIEQRQRQIKIQFAAYDRYASYRPRSVRKPPCLRADAARRRGVMLGHRGGASDQNDVGQGTYSSENIFVSRSSQRTGDSIDLGSTIDCRDHVHHQPWTAVHHWSAVAIGVVGIDLS